MVVIRPRKFFRQVLLWGVWTDEGTFDITAMTLRHQCPADVLADVVAHKDQGSEITTTEFTERPANLGTGTQRNHVAPAGSVVDKGLAVLVPVVPSLKRICENNFTDRSTSQVVNFAFIDPWGLSLLELALREGMNGNPTSGRRQATIQLNRTTKTLVANPHETSGEVRHVQRVARIIRSTGWCRSHRG